MGFDSSFITLYVKWLYLGWLSLKSLLNLVESYKFRRRERWICPPCTPSHECHLPNTRKTQTPPSLSRAPTSPLATFVSVSFFSVTYPASLSLSLSLHFHSLMGWSQCSLLGGNVTAITLFSSWNQNKKKALFSAGACFFVVFLRVCVCWASNGTYSSLFFFLNVFSCEPLSARDTTTTSIFRRDPPLFFRRWNGFGSEASSPGAAFSAKIHLYFSKDEMGCPQTSPRAAFLARIYLYFSKEEWVALLPLVYFAKTPNKPLILHFFAEPHLLFISRAFQKDHLSYLF